MIPSDQHTFNHSRRFGYTLVELMVVLSVSSTLLAVAIGWIHQSMTFGSVVDSHRSHHQALLRFATQFREDVHRASSVEIVNPVEVIMRSDESSSIVYRIDGAEIDRVVRAGDAATSEETFTLALGTTTNWLTDKLPGSFGVIMERASGLPSGQTIPDTESDQTTSPRRPVDLVLEASVARYKALPPSNSDDSTGAQP